MSLPQNAWRVLGADLNCSEAMRSPSCEDDGKTTERTHAELRLHADGAVNQRAPTKMPRHDSARPVGAFCYPTLAGGPLDERARQQPRYRRLRYPVGPS